jgi:hypothetical protein
MAIKAIENTRILASPCYEMHLTFQGSSENADRSPGVPIEVRPDVDATVPAGPTGELRLEIRQPDIIRPLAGVDCLPAL